MACNQYREMTCLNGQVEHNARPLRKNMSCNSMNSMEPT